MRAERNVALVGATIYATPADEPIRDGVVLVRGAEIAAVGRRELVDVPQTAETLDCSGLTIAAGFWNSHVHFFERMWADAAAIPAPDLERQLRTYTRYGFTSVFDLSSMWQNTRQIRERITSGEVPGPAIYSTGEGLVPPGALPPESVLNIMGMMRTPLPEISDAAQASAATRNLLDNGVDGIKLFVSAQSSNSLAQSAMDAAVDLAHQNGKPVFAHPNSGMDVLGALRAGVDVIAHTTPRSGPWDEAILAAMYERRAALTPTLALWQYSMRHDRVSIQDEVTGAAIGQVRAWRAAGGTILFGTDAGAIDVDPTGEYILMARAGMNFREILASLTTAPAERFGESKRLGRIAQGFQADLVVLRGDPSENVRGLSAVEYTLRAGSIIYRAPEHGPRR